MCVRLYRLLWVDTVEIVWVTILSVYAQQQRDNLAAATAACELSEESMEPPPVPVLELE